MRKVLLDIDKLPPLTLSQAKSLKRGDHIYSRIQTTSGGLVVMWRVNGAAKTWKRAPNRVTVPIKHGLRDYGYVTEHNLTGFSVYSPVQVGLYG